MNSVTSTNAASLQQLSAACETALEQGDRAAALEHCRQMLELDPAFSQAHMLTARAQMPGVNYGRILANIHAHLEPSTYVEIGVATGASLAHAAPDTRAVAIDPEPRINRRIQSRARLYPITSDEFFGRYDLAEELGGEPPALAFIDGLHLFEQALKDFINIEKNATPRTVVLVHDCCPPTELSAERERAMAYWCGDVWRLIPCLREFRPDLSVSVIPAMPSGLGLILGLDPESTTLEERFDDIVERYLAMSFESLEKDKAGLLNLVDNDWESIAAIIDSIR